MCLCPKTECSKHYSRLKDSATQQLFKEYLSSVISFTAATVISMAGSVARRRLNETEAQTIDILVSLNTSYGLRLLTIER